MAKLKAPLLSFGASGAIAKAIVYFGWKGLNVAREYVIPANPRTAGQTTQRGYLTAAVALVHTCQAYPVRPLNEADNSALALWGSTYPTPRTWFNQFVKHYIEQMILGRAVQAFTDGITTPDAGQLAVDIALRGVEPTEGSFKYGNSKTALIHTQPATIADGKATATITGLTKGFKYFWQLVITAPETQLSWKSGIYYGTPT